MTISLRVPADPRSRLRQLPSAKRSSLAMSEPLDELDRLLGTVQHGKAGVVLLARRHGAVAQDLPVALVVLTEQARSKVVAATVPLAVTSGRSVPSLGHSLLCAAVPDNYVNCFTQLA